MEAIDAGPNKLAVHDTVNYNHECYIVLVESKITVAFFLLNELN